MSAKKKTKTPAAKSAKPAKTVSSDPMNLGLLEEMVRLMSAHDLNTVDVRNGDRRIVLKRGAPATTYLSAPGYAAPAAAGSPATNVAAASAAAGAEVDTTLVPIKSPMVGTFYSSPSPDSKAFVQVGTAVSQDSDVCVIEAMKVFNSIKAECSGTISKVLVANGSTVEFGQVLFLVKP